jgi:hypothetical protein
MPNISIGYPTGVVCQAEAMSGCVGVDVHADGHPASRVFRPHGPDPPVTAGRETGVEPAGATPQLDGPRHFRRWRTGTTGDRERDDAVESGVEGEARGLGRQVRP